MHPPSPVSIPPDVDITMKATDHLVFKFTEAGIFCSSDADDFNPALPHGQTFAVGATWPDPTQYPKGAQPTGDKDSTYRYKTKPDAHCGEPSGTAGTVIHVGSSRR